MIRFPSVLLFLTSLTAPSLHAEILAEFVSASEPGLSNPHDLKLSPDGRHLLVSDVGNDRVAFLDPESLAFVGEFGSEHQSGTHDVDFDEQGNVYVADTHNNRVLIYRLEGTKAKLTDELDERIRGPEGVLAHPNGRVYVAGAWSNNVVAYENGKLVHELDGLASPHDLELAADGQQIWLADAANDRVLLLTESLQIKQELSPETYRFNGVRYMDLLDDGTLILADKNNHQVKFIRPDGAMPLVLGDGQPGKGPDRFTTPEGVEVRGHDVWFSDSGNNRVVRYRLKLP